MCWNTGSFQITSILNIVSYLYVYLKYPNWKCEICLRVQGTLSISILDWLDVWMDFGLTLYYITYNNSSQFMSTNKSMQYRLILRRSRKILRPCNADKTWECRTRKRIEIPSISSSNPRFQAYRHSQGHKNTSDLLVLSEPSVK